MQTNLLKYTEYEFTSRDVSLNPFSVFQPLPLPSVTASLCEASLAGLGWKKRGHLSNVWKAERWRGHFRRRHKAMAKHIRVRCFSNALGDRVPPHSRHFQQKETKGNQGEKPVTTG
jgi:hypothetical protein